MTKIPQSQNMIQLLHSGHGPAGNPKPVVMVCDVDPLRLQGLHLNVTLPPGPIIAMLPLAVYHVFINMSIHPHGLAKLPLDVGFALDRYGVGGLICHSVGASGCSPQGWGCCHHKC